jgi:protoporphyrinogen IX oxidase
MWLKALHLVFMVTWFAGLFYLPRLFVYHAMSEDEISIERFKIMEKKLYFGIMTPGMVLTLLFGIWMLIDYAWLLYKSAGWLLVKIGLLIGLIAFHFYCGYCVREFRYNRNRHSHVYYRWINEIPVLFLFAIVLLATLKPF